MTELNRLLGEDRRLDEMLVPRLSMIYPGACFLRWTGGDVRGSLGRSFVVGKIFGEQGFVGTGGATGLDFVASSGLAFSSIFSTDGFLLFPSFARRLRSMTLGVGIVLVLLKLVNRPRPTVFPLEGTSFFRVGYVFLANNLDIFEAVPSPPEEARSVLVRLGLGCGGSTFAPLALEAKELVSFPFKVFEIDFFVVIGAGGVLGSSLFFPNVAVDLGIPLRVLVVQMLEGEENTVVWPSGLERVTSGVQPGAENSNRVVAPTLASLTPSIKECRGNGTRYSSSAPP